MEGKESQGAERPEVIQDPGLQSLQEASQTAFVLLKVALLVLIAGYLFSGFFKVREHERAIILRFGRFAEDSKGNRVRGSGLQSAFPYPIDEKIRCSTEWERALFLNGFWYAMFANGQPVSLAREPGAPPVGLDPTIDGHALSGDLNILHYRWVVRYAVSDFAEFFANFRDADPRTDFRDADELVGNIVYNAIVRATAATSVDDALYKGRQDLGFLVQKEAHSLLENLSFGSCIVLRGIELIEASPPRAVAAAFQSVVQAENEKDSRIREAEGYANRVLNEAMGEARSLESNAAAKAAKILYAAQADSRYMSDLLGKYDDPVALRVFLEQLHLERIEKVLQGVQEKFILRNPEGLGTRELRIRMTRDPNAVRDAEMQEKRNRELREMRYSE